MTERSRPWGGITTGDSGPYSDDQWTDVWAAVLGPVVAREGVLKNQDNQVEASVAGGVSPVSIATGKALVDGAWYESDAIVTHAIATPAAGLERFDRIVLRKDWALQTVRQFVITGTPLAAPATVPAITQVDGTTWDVALWIVHITDAGVLTVNADERVFVGQYNPAGGSPQKVYIEDDFLEGANYSNGDTRRMWSAVINASGNIDVMVSDTEIKAGGLTFGHDGIATGDGGQLSSGKWSPTSLNADVEFICKSPNSDADMDRYCGFLSDSQDITPANGVFFRQEGAGNWFGVTRSGGVETTVDIGVANTDVIKRLRFRIFGSTCVAFFLDDVFVGASITNVPTLTDIDLRIGALDDGVAPAAAQYWEYDWIRVQGDR